MSPGEMLIFKSVQPKMSQFSKKRMDN